MMILDLNNVMFASILMQMHKTNQTEIDNDLVGHIVYNVIRSLNVQFRSQYNTMVIATDSSKYWRKQEFPYYKASRKKQREASDLNWTKIFDSMNVVKDDLRNVFPYKYIEVLGAEADDIIGVICKSATNDILILSSDKDYLQLQTNPNVRQYDPVNKKFLTTDNPKRYLFEQIVRGDSGDGIPNIASPSNCFVLGQRQKRITQKMLDSLTEIDNQPDNPFYENYIRNKRLIDLAEIPQQIQSDILEQFSQPNKKDRSKLWPYFSKKGMKVLAETINDF